MMEKRHAWPEGHWDWPIRVTHKHGLRCAEMVWVGGQVDLTPELVVCNPGDLAAKRPLEPKAETGHRTRND